MRASLPFLASALLLGSLVQALAGDAAPSGAGASASAASDSIDTTAAEPGNFQNTYDFDGDASYAGRTGGNFGRHIGSKISEQRDDDKFVVSTQYNGGPIYRFGLSYQRYSFGLTSAAPIPNTLQAENLVLGVDFSLFNSWLIRVEADPGFYGDSRIQGFRTFNVPFTIGGSYIASDQVQWVAGLEVDIDRQIPVFPAVGIHWSLSDTLTLDAVLPTPRLEYAWSKALTLYVGADVDDGTYKVSDGVGAALHRKKLSGSVVEYDELRLGAGITWKLSKVFTLEFEGGILPYREFDFHRADTQFTNDSDAPYGQFSLNAQF